MAHCTKCGRYVSVEGERCSSCKSGGLLGALGCLAILVLGLPVFCCMGISSIINPNTQPPPTNDKVLVNKASIGKVLAVPDKTARISGCPVQLWHPVDECKNQLWYMRDTGGGYFAIVDKTSGFVLDANESQSQNNGCPVTLGTPNYGYNQQWRSVNIGEYVKIIHRTSSKVLEADSEGVFKNGCGIRLWDDNKGDQCLWKLK